MTEGAGDTGWEQLRYPTDRLDGPSPVDALALWDSRDRGATSSLAALPPLPLVDDPTAVYTCGPDTATILARAAVRTGILRMKSRVRIVMLLLAWVFAGWCFADLTGAVAVGLLIGVPLALTPRTLRKKYLRFAGPGEVMASKFGPAAVELHTVDGRIRLRYDALTALLVQPRVVALRGRAGFAAYPRELFPDYALDAIAASAPPLLPQRRATSPAHLPDLPPIPPLTQPTSEYTATPYTTGELVAAMSSQRTRTGVALITLGLTLIVPGLWLRTGGTPDLPEVAGIAGAAGLFIVVMSPALGRILPSAAELHRELDGFTSPGRTVALQLGPDSFDVRTDTFRYRVNYRSVRGLRVRPNAVVLLTDTLSVPLPAALFSVQTIAHLYAVCPRLRRDNKRRRHI